MNPSLEKIHSKPPYDHIVYNGFEIKSTKFHTVKKDGEVVWDWFQTMEGAKKMVDTSNAMKVEQSRGLKINRPELIEDENGLAEAEGFREWMELGAENQLNENNI